MIKVKLCCLLTLMFTFSFPTQVTGQMSDSPADIRKAWEKALDGQKESLERRLKQAKDGWWTGNFGVWSYRGAVWIVGVGGVGYSTAGATPILSQNMGQTLRDNAWIGGVASAIVIVATQFIKTSDDELSQAVEAFSADIKFITKKTTELDRFKGLIANPKIFSPDYNATVQEQWEAYLREIQDHNFHI